MTWVRLMTLGAGLCVAVGCGDDGGGGDAAGTGTTSQTSQGSSGSPGDDDSGPSMTTMDPDSTGAPGDTGDPPDDISQLSDEFDDPGSLADWQLRHEVEGTEAQYTLLDIDTSNAGRLTWVPVTSGWYNDFDGPFLYKEVTGDFMVEIWVDASLVGSPSEAPTELFNSAGMLIRDPDTGPNQESWVMHNVGRQQPQIGTEGKTTNNSNSMFDLITGAKSGVLRICRVGGRISLTRQLDDETGFRETHTYDRTDLPDTLQVGLCVNGWNSDGGSPDFGRDPDIYAQYDYIRFSRITSVSECLQ